MIDIVTASMTHGGGLEIEQQEIEIECKFVHNFAGSLRITFSEAAPRPS